MKIETFDGGPERQVVIGMVVSDQVLARLVPHWEGRGQFASDAANLVGHLCVTYFRRHGKAPGKDVKALFLAWASKRPQGDPVAAMAEQFLTGLSGEYETAGEVNPEFVVDLARGVFDAVKAQKAIDTASGFLAQGQTDQAIQTLHGLKATPLGQGGGSDLTSDHASVLAAFADEKTDVLINYPGPLGVWFGYGLERGGFVAFVAPTGVGKTFWLLDLAYRAMTQRRRVAYFQVGDMSHKQILRRFAARAACHPVRSPSGLWPYVVDKPVKITPQEKGPALVDCDRVTFPGPLDGPGAVAALQRVQQHVIKSNESYMKVKVSPAGTFTAADVEAAVLDYQATGWNPDVVVIDYADLLAGLPGVPYGRDQINATWMALRGLSLKMHCLVATATQSDAAGFDKYLLDKNNFSDDKRKFDHCTAVYGINQTPSEKESQIYRLNPVKLREGPGSVRRMVHCAACLAVANPAVVSAL